LPRIEGAQKNHGEIYTTSSREHTISGVYGKTRRTRSQPILEKNSKFRENIESSQASGEGIIPKKKADVGTKKFSKTTWSRELGDYLTYLKKGGGGFEEYD